MPGNRTSGRTPAIAARVLAAAFGILMSMPHGPTQADAQPSADLLKRAKGVFEPIPTEPPQLSGNPLTPEKVELGKMLFFEPRLSASWFISCNSCHNMATGGVDLQPDIHRSWLAPGWTQCADGAQFGVQLRPVLGRARQGPDGSRPKGPVQAAVEMNNKPERMSLATFNAIPELWPALRRGIPG